jgi:plasmid maintenance system antidote protein VapI
MKVEVTAVLPDSRIATHSGAILEEEFLRPWRLPEAKLARALHIPLNRVNEMVRGKRGVSPKPRSCWRPTLATRPNSG